MRKMATDMLLKQNQSLNTIQSLSSSPSPNDFFNKILIQLKEWLAVAMPFAIAALGVVLACLFCCCFLPAIINCIVWVVVMCWNLVRGLFMLVWGTCVMVCRACCCCGASTVKMMKAPGRGGKVFMPRSVFESSPSAYFSNLRAGNPV